MSTATSTFNDIVARFDLKQHVSFSPDIHGHWLDLLVTRSTMDYIRALTTTDGLSDHFTVIGEIFKHNPVNSKCNTLYRDTPDIDILAFNDDIVKSELITNPTVITNPSNVNNTTLHLKPYLTNTQLSDQNPSK